MSKSHNFRFPAGMPDVFDLRVKLCRAEVIDQWVYNGIIHPCWLLYWNPDRGAEIHYEGRVWEMTADRVFLIPPFTRFSTRSARIFRHCYIHFETTPPFDRVRRGILTFSSEMIRNFFRKLEEENTQESAPALLHGLLCHYLCEIPDEQFLEPGTSILAPVIRRAAELMNKHLQEPLPNRELCRKSGLNLNDFYRQFRKEMGMTPKRYLLSLRMEQAREKLLHSDLPLEEIAEQTGYADRFHFSKAFRNFYGEPPASYRKKYGL